MDEKQSLGKKLDDPSEGTSTRLDYRPIEELSYRPRVPFLRP
jgi:hypothetical protein